MINIIRLYFNNLEVNPQKIHEWIKLKKSRELSICLKKYDDKIRNVILSSLSNEVFLSKKLINELIEIVKTDFIPHAKIAMELLGEIESSNSQESIADAKAILNERTRKKNNQIKFQRNYKIESSRSVFDKKDMIRLSQVKQGLKKSLR